MAELKAQASLIAPGRVESFQADPESSLRTLSVIMSELPLKLQARPDVIRILSKAGIDTASNTIHVASTSPVAAEAFFDQIFGASAPITVTLAPSKPVTKELPRSRPKDQKLYAGDWLSGPEAYCSAGFGASEALAKKPNQEQVFAHFALTAGHCYPKGATVSRRFRKTSSETGEWGFLELGKIGRRVYENSATSLFNSDGEAIRLESGIETPMNIYLSSERSIRPVQGVEAFTIGSTLCTSGTYSGFHCGVATEPFLAFPGERMEYVVEATSITAEGDSGGPVWDLASGKAVGLVEGGYNATSPTWLTPLLSVPLPGGVGTAPGLLEELDAPPGGGLLQYL